LPVILALLVDLDFVFSLTGMIFDRIGSTILGVGAFTANDGVERGSEGSSAASLRKGDFGL
jgi:hypothetical protein